VVRVTEAAALSVWETLGCRDVARLDFRVREGVPYFLEANPLPGLNPESSDLVIMANLLNISHAELVTMIVTAALRRCGLS
jgi:D-alanine-D-alanine ligase